MREPTAKERAADAVRMDLTGEPDVFGYYDHAIVRFMGEPVGGEMTVAVARAALETLRRGTERLIEDMTPPAPVRSKWAPKAAEIPAGAE